MYKEIIKYVVKDKGDLIVAILWENEVEGIIYKPAYTSEGKLMEVSIYMELKNPEELVSYERYVGSILCWGGTIEKHIMYYDSEGILKEKED